MANIELRFNIEETTTAVGRVIVDQDKLAAYMEENGITALTLHDLPAFLEDEGIEVDEKFPNVINVAWTGLRAGESTPNEVTVPLYRDPALTGS